MRWATAIVVAGLTVSACSVSPRCGAGTMAVGDVCLPSDAGPPEDDAGPTDAPIETDAPAPSDAGPCGGLCEGTALPLCDTSTDTCVECLAPTDCSAPDLACVAGACEQCDGNEDCTSADTSRCNLTTNICENCLDDTSCGHDGLGGICDTAGGGMCVECTGDDETACGPSSCNPLTAMCTTTPRLSVRRCGACLADSECTNTDDRCVPMMFMGAAHGSFCLKQADTGCAAPFTTPTTATASTSGAAAEIYCGIDQVGTTCEAVLDLVDDTTCTMDADCGTTGLADGLCRSVNFVANRCTYGCAAASTCVGGFGCPSMTYCGSP